MRSYPLSVVAVLAAGCLLGACGSSSSSKSSSSNGAKQLPSAVFAQKGDAICTATDAKLKVTGGDPPQFDPATATKAQVSSSVRFLTAQPQAMSDTVSQINALGEPQESAPRQAWHQLSALLLNQTIPDLQKAADDARRADVKAFRVDFAKLLSPGPAPARLQKVIGFKVCGNG